jgi:hypothetical protein
VAKQAVAAPVQQHGNSTANKEAFALLVKATNANLAKAKVAIPAWLKEPSRWYLRGWYNQVLTHKQMQEISPRPYTGARTWAMVNAMQAGTALAETGTNRAYANVIAMVYTYQTGGQYIKATIKAMETLPGRQPKAAVVAQPATPSKAKASKPKVRKTAQVAGATVLAADAQAAAEIAGLVPASA